VKRAIEVFAGDLDIAQRARPELTPEDLVEEALARGLALIGLGADPGGDDDLRVDLADAVAEASAIRWILVTSRDRFVDARESEQQTYLEHLDLERDVVPPMKLEAQRLRKVLRGLEAKARVRGVDLAAIEPQIDWMNTISVEGYAPPRFQSNAERRETSVRFFRRLGRR
jgi:hypothetical protein